MSAELTRAAHAAPLPSPLEGGGFPPPTPLRPGFSFEAPLSPQPPLLEGITPFPTHLARPPRPYLLSPETRVHEVLDYTDIPKPAERRRAGKTALHESHHVLIASSLGIPVERVEVIPGKDYLGITVFKGDLRNRPHALQLIAAGGAVETLDGKAEGFGHRMLHGSDLHVVDSVSHLTGTSAEEAVQEATERLAKIPENVRRIVADIIETKQVVYASELIARIIDIACFEAQAGINAEYIEEAFVGEVLGKEQYEASIARGDTTIIITPTEGPHYVLVDEKKNPLEELKECPQCQGKGGHTEDCKKKGNEEDSRIQTQELQPISRLPVSANVFDRKRHLRIIK